MVIKSVNEKVKTLEQKPVQHYVLFLKFITSLPPKDFSSALITFFSVSVKLNFHTYRAMHTINWQIVLKS